LYNIELKILVPRGISEEKLNLLKLFCNKIHFVDKEMSDEEIRDHDGSTLNVTPGFDNVGILGFESISREIINTIYPDVIVVPYGTGESLLGIYNGFKRYSDKIPRFIAVTSDCDEADSLCTEYRHKEKEVKRIVKETHGRIIILDKDEIKESLKISLNNLFLTEPSSSVVFYVMRNSDILRDGEIGVCINSGSGLKCINKLRRLIT
jgi:threonine synthase